MNFPPPTSKQAHVIWFSATALAVAVCVALLAGLLWGLGQVLNLLSPVLWPLAVAGVIACVLDPAVDFLERKKVPRTRAIVLVFVIGLMLLGALISSVVPRLVDEAGELMDRVPAYSKQVQERVAHWLAEPPRQVRWLFKQWNPWAVAPAPSPAATNAPSPTTPGLSATNTAVVGPSASPGRAEWEKRIAASAIGWVTEFLPKAGEWLLEQLSRVTALFAVFLGLGLVPVYTFYFLHEKRGIESKWTDYLPVQDSRFKDELVFVLNAIKEYLVAFFRGQVLVAACDAVFYTIGFLAIGLRYAFLLGVFAFFLTLIPFLGAMIISVAAVFLAAVQFQDVRHPVLVLGVFGLVQALDGLLISPKIMGGRVGLHPLTILIAVMAGTTLLGGLLGGILAIPLTAALRVVMFRYIWKKR